MRHAIRAAWVFAPPILLPFGCLDQLLVGTGISIRHQVTGSLPAQHRIAGNAPGRAAKIDLTLQEVQEEWGVVQTPLLTPAIGERLAKDFPCPLDAKKMLLVGGFLIGVARRDLHDIDLHLVVQEVEYVANAARIVLCEECRVGGNAESP